MTPNQKNRAITSLGAFALAVCIACAPAKSPLVDGDLAEDEALFQEALALYDAADFAGAQPKFDQLVADFPESSRHDNAGYLAGRCRYEQGLYDDAIPLLLAMRAAHADSPFFPSAAYFTGRCRYELLDFVGAVADFEAATVDSTATYADNAQYYAGRSSYEAEQYAEAAAAFDVLETVYPASTLLDNGRYYLGRTFFNQGLFDEAIPPFERVFLTVDSIYLDNAAYYIARSDYGAGRLDDSLAGFAAVVADFPDSQYVDNALYYSVRVHVDQADCLAAQDALDALTTQAPASPELPRAQSYMSNNGC